jgi:biotin synthase
MREIEFKAIEEAVEKGLPVSDELALGVLGSEGRDLPRLFAAASRARERYFGSAVRLCSILNARSGACGEDCAFCAQASCHQTGVKPVPLLSVTELIEAYEKASELPISHFGVVTSGCALSTRGVERISRAVRSRKTAGLSWCASLGCLDKDQLAALKEAGLKRFHHNLETAESFFPQICTTHTYEKRLETVRAAREAGLEVCCGGILGMGESFEQRVEFAGILARERVDSIPLNFLIPIPGTRMENLEVMKPRDILRTVAMFRLTNPSAEIKVCAGRVHLRDLQAMLFHAGATGMMIGPLLTVAGRDVSHDLQMLRDLEVEYA